MTPTETIQRSENLTEKYYRINQDFPEMAGKIASIIAVQKRLVHKMAKSKSDDSTKALLLSVAQGIEVTEELLEWMRLMLKEVAKDAAALVEGGKARTTAKWAAQLNAELMDVKDSTVGEWLNGLK